MISRIFERWKFLIECMIVESGEDGLPAIIWFEERHGFPVVNLAE
jgi:hypothetical protein